MIKLGDTNITAVKLGDANISKVYQGETLIMGGSTPPQPSVKLPEGSEFNFNAKRFNTDRIKNDVEGKNDLIFENGTPVLIGDYLTISNCKATCTPLITNITSTLNVIYCVTMSNKANALFFNSYDGYKGINIYSNLSGIYAVFGYCNNTREPYASTAALMEKPTDYTPILLNCKTEFIVKNLDNNSQSQGVRPINNISNNGVADYVLFTDAFDAQYWEGKFKWIYLTYNDLTDEEIQQVIEFNNQ